MTFKLVTGARVRLVRSEFGGIATGTEGTIVEVLQNDGEFTRYYPYKVKFDGTNYISNPLGDREIEIVFGNTAHVSRSFTVLAVDEGAGGLPIEATLNWAFAGRATFTVIENRRRATPMLDPYLEPEPGEYR